MTKRTLLLGLLGLLLIVATAVYLWFDQENNPERETVVTPHLESTTPEDGAVLAGVPINVTLDFNLDLVGGSSILIMREGVEYSVGPTTIDENKLAMRRQLSSEAPDGMYVVKYRACWINNSCANGQYFFSIDRRLSSAFSDFRNQDEVIIDMNNIRFLPEKIRIKPGTKVTWKNSDSTSHYVNTDAHPAHTYHVDQNSREIVPGESYITVFDRPGIYPYHCSAHASTMVGSILVE